MQTLLYMAAATYLGLDGQPVCQVCRVGDRGGEAHKADLALRLGADVAHARDDDLQDRTPAAAIVSNTTTLWTN